MKCIIIGNLAKRTEVKGKKKETILSSPSFFGSINSARLGHDTTLVSKLSSEFDKKWLKFLEKEGIKLIKQPAWKDTSYEVKYDKTGNKMVTVTNDAGPIVNIPEIKADVVLINSYFGNVNLNVLKKLKTEDNLLALDAQGFIKYKNPGGEISNVPWLEKEKYLKYVDILKLNARELYFLTGKTTLNSASELLKLGPKIVTLTLAEQGAYIFHRKKFIKVPVYETKTVDKTGAGDVFASTFVIRYKETEDIMDAAYFAAAAASYCIEKKGEKGIEKLKKVEKRYKTLREIFLA